MTAGGYSSSISQLRFHHHFNGTLTGAELRDAQQLRFFFSPKDRVPLDTQTLKTKHRLTQMGGIPR